MIHFKTIIFKNKTGDIFTHYLLHDEIYNRLLVSWEGESNVFSVLIKHNSHYKYLHPQTTPKYVSNNIIPEIVSVYPSDDMLYTCYINYLRLKKIIKLL